MEKIKSLKITKLIFSSLDEGIKLNIIKYNKRMQNKINIEFINYQIFSGKYIIYESNKILI